MNPQFSTACVKLSAPESTRNNVGFLSVQEQVQIGDIPVPPIVDDTIEVQVTERIQEQTGLERIEEQVGDIPVLFLRPWKRQLRCKFWSGSGSTSDLNRLRNSSLPRRRPRIQWKSLSRAPLRPAAIVVSMSSRTYSTHALSCSLL